MTARRKPATVEQDAVATALLARDWERAALLLLLGVCLAARALPGATVDEAIMRIAAETRDD